MAAVRLAHLSLFHAGAAIQAEVDVSVVVEELLQHVQHACHLSEDQHPVAPSLQLPQQSVESLQLTCALKQRKTTHTLNIDFYKQSRYSRNKKHSTFAQRRLYLVVLVQRRNLTTVVLYEPQVRELSPHVALDTVQTASQWGDLGGQRGGKVRLLLAQRGGRVGGVHGDGRSLHRGDRKRKPSNWRKRQNRCFSCSEG